MIFINLIPHGNLTPDQGFILFIGLFLFSLVGYGIYLTWGSGKKDLRDPIDEHAKMHEQGLHMVMVEIRMHMRCREN